MIIYVTEIVGHAPIITLTEQDAVLGMIDIHSVSLREGLGKVWCFDTNTKETWEADAHNVMYNQALDLCERMKNA